LLASNVTAAARNGRRGGNSKAVCGELDPKALLAGLLLPGGNNT